MSKITAVLISGVSMFTGGFSFALYRAQADWWGWLGVMLIGFAVSLWLCHKDEKRADERARNRIATRYYAALPLAGSKPNQAVTRKPFTYRQGRK